MDPSTLLSMSPELLAKAVLHRREQLLQRIPPRLEELRNELSSISPSVEQSGKSRDDVNSKVSSLKQERNENKAKAFELIRRSKELREKLLSEGRLKNPDPKWVKDKMMEDIAKMEEEFQTKAGDHKAEQKFLRKIKEMMSKHEQGVASRIKNNPEMQELREIQSQTKALFAAAEKAHEAMITLVEESGVYHSSWVAHSSLEGEIKSKIHNLEELMENSSKAEQYWKLILDQGTGVLSRAAQEISNGGLSSYSKRRTKKQKAESAKSKQVGGEEE